MVGVVVEEGIKVHTRTRNRVNDICTRGSGRGKGRGRRGNIGRH